MRQERIEILQMLEADQVTVSEALQLLQSQQNDPVAVDTRPDTTDAHRVQPFHLGEWLQKLGALTARKTVAVPFDWEGDSAALHTLAVQSVNGSVMYTGAAQNTIALHAHQVIKAPDRASAEAFARQVQIRVEPQDGTLRVYADYPKPPRHVKVQVNFTIQGPHTLTVDGQSTNGHVDLRGVEGMVKAQSTNGEVRLAAISGRVEAKSTNGSVRASDLRLTDASHFASQNGSLHLQVQQGQAALEATTVNGSVQLTLPADYQGQLDARTQNGTIRTDFPLQLTQQGRKQLIGKIGGGGEALLKLQSQNGSVTVTAASR